MTAKRKVLTKKVKDRLDELEEALDQLEVVLEGFSKKADASSLLVEELEGLKHKLNEGISAAYRGR